METVDILRTATDAASRAQDLDDKMMSGRIRAMQLKEYLTNQQNKSAMDALGPALLKTVLAGGGTQGNPLDQQGQPQGGPAPVTNTPQPVQQPQQASLAPQPVPQNPLNPSKTAPNSGLQGQGATTPSPLAQTPQNGNPLAAPETTPIGLNLTKLSQDANPRPGEPAFGGWQKSPLSPEQQKMVGAKAEQDQKLVEEQKKARAAQVRISAIAPSITKALPALRDDPKDKEANKTISHAAELWNKEPSIPGKLFQDETTGDWHLQVPVTITEEMRKSLGPFSNLPNGKYVLEYDPIKQRVYGITPPDSSNLEAFIKGLSSEDKLQALADFSKGEDKKKYTQLLNERTERTLSKEERSLQKAETLANLRKSLEERGMQLSPAAIKMIGSRYASGDKAALTAIGFGRFASEARTQVLNKLAEANDTTGDTPQNQMVKQAAFEAAQSELRSMKSQEGKMMANARTADLNADLANDLSKKLDRTGSPILNAWILAGRKATGDPAVAEFETAVRTAINEYASVVLRATGSSAISDAARKEVEGMLNSALNQEQFDRVTALMHKDINNRRAGFDAQTKTITEGILELGGQGKEKPKDAVVESKTITRKPGESISAYLKRVAQNGQ